MPARTMLEGVDYSGGDRFIKQVRDNVTPGTSAIFLLSRNAVEDRVVAAIKEQGLQPELIASNLSNDQESKLRETFSAE